MEIGIYLIKCFYFYLPAALANIGANLGKFIPIFKSIKQPIDFGLKWKGKRLIGDHKNLGSLFFGILFGTLIGIAKTLVFDTQMQDYLLIKASVNQNIWLYFLMSIGALSGDLLKSILKRLFDRPAHSAWIPFDEIDHSVVSLSIASLIVPMSFSAAITIVILFFFLHILSNIIGYYLKIKTVPY